MTEPLVALDPAGEATILSYDVPEPISYSGRNFINLLLPDTAFRTIGTVTKAAPAPNPGQPLLPAQPGAAQMLSHVTVLSPPGVSVALAGKEPAVTTSRPTTDRLAKLSADDAAQLVRYGQQLVVYPTTIGALDYRVVAASAGQQTLTTEKPPPDGGGGRDAPAVSVKIATPVAGQTVPTGDSKLHSAVMGIWTADSVTDVALELVIDATQPVNPTPQPDGTWRAELIVDVAGPHTLVAKISGVAHYPLPKRDVKLSSESTVTFTVELGKGNGDGALPLVTIDTPKSGTSVYGETPLPVRVHGTATGNANAAVTTVRVTDSAAKGAPVDVAPDQATGQWQVDLVLDAGYHSISVIAVDAANRPSTQATVALTVLRDQPRRRIKQRLMLVETLNISSFLGSFGAGRCLKTFTLLPGEKTTLSVKTWTRTADETKAGSSILDSSASDSSDSWESSLAQEQTSKESLTEATAYKISADVGATWGWGHADVHGEYSGSANSAREEACKNVQNALQKHSLSASTNRSVTINSEYNTSVEKGVEESTTREISNINVSRVLNFVFRQMNQEHVILFHLTNVRIAFYAEDLMLNSDGSIEYVPEDPTKPTGNKVPHIERTYEEVTLADLQDLFDAHIVDEFQESTKQGIENALSGIPDYQGDLHEVFEVVVPKRDGADVPEATYLRFPPGLSMTYTHNGASFTVPGVLLATDTVVMRTDAVVVDTILGVGDALDDYSHGLQDAVVAERHAQLAQKELALKIIEDNDAERAALFAKLFPAPPNGMTTTTTSTTPAIVGA